MLPSPLLTIGAFARAVGLTPSALRHYDECGLLVPAEVDHATGYRYYAPDLGRRARLIRVMRGAGVPIESMRAVLDGTPAQAREVLAAFLEERAAGLAQAEASLREVQATIDAGAAPAGPATVRLDGPALAAALRQVRPAAESDPTSPLSGVLVDVTDGSVDVVATNRYWMAVRTLLAPGSGGGSGRVVVSLPDLVALVALLDGSGEVTLEVLGSTLSVHADAAAPHAVRGRTSAYPAHRIVLAGLEPVRTRGVVSATDLRDGIERAGRAEVTLALTAGGAGVGAPEGGAHGGGAHGGGAHGGDGLPGHRVDGVVDGEDVTVVLGSTLVRRALSSCLGDEVVVEVSAPERPVVLRSPYQAGFLALVMPIRPE